MSTTITFDGAMTLEQFRNYTSHISNTDKDGEPRLMFIDSEHEHILRIRSEKSLKEDGLVIRKVDIK